MTNPSTLYRGGQLYCPADPQATALLVRDGRIAWLGVDADAPAADQVVDLDGALVTPAFVDAHMHATGTGLTLTGLDLTEVGSATEILDALAVFAAGLPADAMVFGNGWDESRWSRPELPTAQELDRAAQGRRVYLSRVCGHSALCSTAMMTADPRAAGLVGYDESGWLRLDAHHLVAELAFGSFSPAQRTAVQRAALRRAASLGVAAVHECAGPGTSDENDLMSVLALSGAGLPEVYGYWGELMASAKARELGAVGAGGDLYADGALGSRTAFLSESYLDGAGCGHGYVTAEQVRDHLLDCAEHGMQGGFHAIGDAAIGTVVAGFGLAARTLGVERLRAARHRVEHAEIMNKATIAGFVEFGIVASVQPAFDRLWGGEHQMYASRLGVARSLESNPMGAMHSVGVMLALGSDAPVTPLDPWGSVRAAMSHFNPAQRLSVKAAFAAHTRGGWRAVHRDDEGVLVPGAPATFAVWSTPAGLDRGLPVLVSEVAELRGPQDPTPLPVCRRTVLRGEVIYEEGTP